MAFKIVIVCAFALFQTISGQCIGSPFNSAFGLAANGLAASGLGNGFASNLAGNGFASNLAGNGFASNLAGNLAGFNSAFGAGCGGGVASTGGGLPVTSSSPVAPTGVSVVSENAYEGPLAASGNLPFLGTVAMEGTLPTAGAGAVSYGCGDGVISIGSDGPFANLGSYPPAAAPAAAGLGYNGLGSVGAGLGRFGGL